MTRDAGGAGRAAAAVTASAQVSSIYSNARGQPIRPNVDYAGSSRSCACGHGPPIPYQTQRVPWSHDYPTGEQHFREDHERGSPT